MASSKPVLILHASAGHGHKKAAEAVAEALTLSGRRADVVDSLDLLPKFFARSYKESYLSMIQSSPWLWGFLYYWMDSSFFQPLIRPIRRIVNSVMTGRMRSKILKDQPDVLVCTHFMSVEVAGAMKRRRQYSGKIVVVVTDYLAHAFWIDSSADVYAVGCEKTREDLLRRGVSPEKIVVTGLPTAQAFRVPRDREAIRSALGLPAAAPTLILTSGGAGVGPLEQMVTCLAREDARLRQLVVCGTNRVLFDRLSEVSKSYPSLRVFGFVNNMHDLMTASDLMIGKAGGLTVSECLCLSLPMIMVQPVPGQEERNAAVVSAVGAGVTARSADETIRLAREILGDPIRLQQMKVSAQNMAKPNAADRIAALADTEPAVSS